jgi:hypothetical protein
MTRANAPSGNGAGPRSVESLLRELIGETRKLHARRNPLRHAIAWAIAVCIAAVISNVTVPGAHRAYVTAGCYFKYFTEPGVTRPSASSFQGFGTTSVTQLSGTAFSVTPKDQGYIWFGADMPFTRYCDYRIDFYAELIGPANPQLGGYGYGIGVRGFTVNGVPSATTIQYDPPFGGLRIVPIPCCANSPGYNPFTSPSVIAGVYRHWRIDVIGSNAYVSFEGKGYGQMNLGSGDEVLLRVWNASVDVKDMTITPIKPSV